MIIVNRFNNQYKSLNSTERYKALTLLFILLAVFLFCLYSSINEVRAGHFFYNPGYYIIGFLSPFLVVFILLGYYRPVVFAVLISFTLAQSFSQLFGEFREIEILNFILLIAFASIYTRGKVSIFLILYCFLYLILLYFLKKDSQEFSPYYLPYSLFFLVLISAVNILNSWILERNIDEIKEEVFKRTNELNAAKEYAELIFHNNPSAAYTVDQSGRISDCNRKAEELTGYKREELIGLNETILTLRMENSLTKLHFDKSGQTVGIILTKKGKEITIARYSALLTDEKGGIAGKIVSFTDLTDWMEFERYKTDMERVIRHDLKTPLNSVIGFPTLMLEDKNLSEDFRESLTIIRNAGTSMRQLIDASRYLYKIEEGLFEPDPEKTDIIAVLHQIDSDLTDMKIRNHIELKILIDGKKTDRNSKLNLVTEKILIQMILSNLIKNAMEASPSHSEVLVSLSTIPSLSIAIHNEGVIPESIRDSFFDKYVSMNKKAGTGLGTYSAKIMSRAIGAQLSFSSTQDEGTELRLVFS